MIDFIQGQRFWEIADMVYYPKGAKDCNPLENTYCPCALKERNIIYTHTMYVRQLFEEIKKLKCVFVIVTHNCDENVDDSFQVPNNVIKWFTQNVNTSNPKIEAIPIGLENDKWFKNVHKKEKMEATLRTPKKYKNLVYLNSNIKTNPKERQPLYDLFEKEPWCTSFHGANGEGFDEYLNDIYNHKFVFCPDGNGIDTHRLWETLYMGTIPIIKLNKNTRQFSHLPLYFVEEWEEVNPEYLEEYWNYVQITEWDMEMLTFKYWKNKIRNCLEFTE
jgi:hypothetical protein